MADSITDPLLLALNATLTIASRAVSAVPGSSIAIKYIKASHQNDPYRTLLEAALVAFMVWYYVGTKHKPGSSDVKLTEKEIQELIDEWEPEPLVQPLTDFQQSELEKLPVIIGSVGGKPKFADGKERLNLASYNFLGLMNQEFVKEKAVEALRTYGVGTCGPRGFYGTIDVHMQLEEQIAKFIGSPAAVLYSQGFSTIASVIPAFAKRGDILVADDGVGFAIQKGLQISRSRVKYFKHNDMEDLERVLESLRVESLKAKQSPARRFIVTEGLFANSGDICPLPKLLEMRNKYKFRLILDESFSIGVLGKRGAGVTDHFGVPATNVDMIVGSIANAFGSAGGFCCGSEEVVELQRLGGQAYCFSASLPAMLTVAAAEAIRALQADTEVLTQLRENIDVLRDVLLRSGAGLPVIFDGAPQAPFVHVRLATPLADREEEERALQEVVDEAARNGVLLTRAKYVWSEELNPPRPSIRITVSAALSKKETEKAATVVKEAIKKVLKARK
ncbi:pyridoxal phosphate-dependent transferase [Blyttiomyces helicus]|uniref:serine C-palmitoyltransferase n=1 Tax=Blyttiomyces helicus TaxID=388810 RepID=A0A4P9VZD7_9FUNG|nr:pyridoxal phosphate-dependent transferase [Blyttiomyces helicus]|eukprot:RKO85134.1 pyridoxal phosphate-dependent transferase [Blyttiomyces helicus]